MAEMLLKPYELSVWEEELDRQQGNYKENKIAVIASNTVDIKVIATQISMAAVQTMLQVLQPLISVCVMPLFIHRSH